MLLNFQSYGKGFPLIILHGLFGMLDNWHTLSKMLASDFQVLALDQRNHGRSPHSAGFNYQMMAEDVREFMDQQAIHSVYLLGHSMGGKTAMQVALTYPHLIEKLVVIDIAPRAYSSLHDSILDALNSVDLDKCKSRQDIEMSFSTKIPQPAVRQFLMKNLARNEDSTFRWKMNLPVITASYQEVLRKVSSESPFPKPTLVVRSTKSSYINDADLAEFKALFPQLSVSSFDTGHWVHAEAPEQLAKTVTGFLLQQGS